MSVQVLLELDLSDSHIVLSTGSWATGRDMSKHFPFRVEFKFTSKVECSWARPD